MTNESNRTAGERASLAVAAWNEFPGKNSRGHYKVSIEGRDILISDIRFGDEEGFVDIYLGGRNPSMRICNPPVLIQDPQGSVEIEQVSPNGSTSVVRYREDPVAAVAALVAQTRRR